MQALIVDDERLARVELRRLLTAHPWIEIAGEAANGSDAIKRIAEQPVDLLFLDIEMPGMNGFEMLAGLERVPQVIFTTAYDAYALEAFRINALDYLLKPIDPVRLGEALSRLSPADIQPKDKRLTLGDKVFVRDGQRCWFVALRDISLFESEGNYTRLYFDKVHPLIHRSLNALEERLDPEHFFRANRGHILNLKWIERLEHAPDGRLHIVLADGHHLEMSRRQSMRFRERTSL
jgi:two-component system LytT family response regulator